MKTIFLDHDGVVCLSNNWGGRKKKWAKYRSENENLSLTQETTLDISYSYSNNNIYRVSY